MEPLHQFLPAAVASLVRDVPLSPGKLAFAWRAAVGPAIDRATGVSLGADGVLEVRVADQHWRREVKRSAPVVLERLAGMLGAGTVKRLEIVVEAREARRRRSG
jgi:predicted nucleic acid-binding Zn ribbon protein